MLQDVLISERYARILTSRFLLDNNLSVERSKYEKLVKEFLKNNGALSSEKCFKIIKGWY